MPGSERGGAGTTQAGPATPASSPPSIQAVPVRHYGRWVAAVLVLLLVAWLVVSAAGTDAVQWGEIPRYLFAASILDGLRNMLLISVLAQAMGIVLGVLLAVMRLSGNPVMAAVSGAFVWFFRGTPVYLQLLVWFNMGLVFRNVTLAVPFTDITLFSMPMNDFMTPFMAALLGLGLNEAAYMAEIVRSGILSVPEGQTEAAMALGMTPGQTMRRIILPQAMRVIIPPTGNEFISLLKLSSLAEVVQFAELMRRARDIYSNNLLVLELLFTISVWYLVVVTIFSIGQYFLERRFARGTRRGGGEAVPLPAFVQRWLRARRRGPADEAAGAAGGGAL
jgi:polar amino acid transport system permease protein